MYEIEAVYEGLAPMMQDRFYDPEELERVKKKAKVVWKAELPLKCYMDKEGVYVPADNIRMMLIGNQYRPGAAMILGSYMEKKKGKEYRNLCASYITVQGPDDALKVYIEPARKTFDRYDERTFVNVQKGRGITRRPIIDLPWRVRFIIQVFDDQLHESKVREFFDVGGVRCGLGAYGPTFGRCVIVEWAPREMRAKEKPRRRKKRK